MKLKICTYLSAILLLAIACEKEPERMQDIFLEFATVVNTSSRTVFKLDNNRLLVPNDNKDYRVEEGKRVIINYTPLQDDVVIVNQVSSIFTGEIKESKDVETVEKDPVKIQSIWVAGGYLNMILEIEYYEKAHKIDLLRNSGESASDLYFAHSRNGDPPGYAKKLYASFSLAALKSAGNPVDKFKLHIRTLDGERVLEFVAPR